MFQQQKENVQLNIDLGRLDTIQCPCGEGNVVFEQKFALKRIPKIQVGAPVDIAYPIPLWSCSKCGAILEEFIPPSAGDWESISSGTGGESKIIGNE